MIVLRVLCLALLANMSACGPRCDFETSDSSRSSVRNDDTAQAMKAPPKTNTLSVEFSAQRDGFSFPNYTNHQKPQDLNEGMMERLCGKTICERRVKNQCVLSGPARVFMDQINKNMDGGHCEGMSALALLLFSGHRSLKDFDQKAAKTYDLGFNNASLQREIAFYYATQNTEPAISSTLWLTPVQVLEKLKRHEDQYIIGVYNRGGNDGHALSYLRVIDDNPTWAKIEVYDSNYAGQLQHVLINKKANNWTYPGYEIGTADSKTLTLHPLAKRLVSQTCLIKGDDDDIRAHASNRYVWLSGPGRLVAPAGARSIWRRDVRAFGQSPMYEVAVHGDIDLLIKGEATQVSEKSSVVVLRSGMSMALEGLNLIPGEIDKLKIGKDGDSFTYSTQDPEQIVFRLGLSYKGDDFEIKIAPKSSDAGFDFQVRNLVDDRLGHHALSISLRDSKTRLLGYTVELTRIGAKSDETFTHRHELVLAPRETDYLQYGKWLKNHQPLEIDKDMKGDGKLKPEMVDDDD